MFIESVMPSNHLILCRPLLLPPSIFPSIGVFSNESVLHIRWPKYERPAVREWALPLNQSFVTEIIYLPAFGARQFDNSGVEMVMTTGPAREEASESDGRFNRN